MQFLQCVSTGDTAVLHYSIDIHCVLRYAFAIAVCLQYFVILGRSIKGPLGYNINIVSKRHIFVP